MSSLRGEKAHVRPRNVGTQPARKASAELFPAQWHEDKDSGRQSASTYHNAQMMPPRQAGRASPPTHHTMLHPTLTNQNEASLPIRVATRNPWVQIPDPGTGSMPHHETSQLPPRHIYPSQYAPPVAPFNVMAPTHADWSGPRSMQAGVEVQPQHSMYPDMYPWQTHSTMEDLNPYNQMPIKRYPAAQPPGSMQTGDNLQHQSMYTPQTHQTMPAFDLYDHQPFLTGEHLHGGIPDGNPMPIERYLEAQHLESMHTGDNLQHQFMYPPQTHQTMPAFDLYDHQPFVTGEHLHGGIPDGNPMPIERYLEAQYPEYQGPLSMPIEPAVQHQSNMAPMETHLTIPDFNSHGHQPFVGEELHGGIFAGNPMPVEPHRADWHPAPKKPKCTDERGQLRSVELPTAEYLATMRPSAAFQAVITAVSENETWKKDIQAYFARHMNNDPTYYLFRPLLDWCAAAETMKSTLYIPRHLLLETARKHSSLAGTARYRKRKVDAGTGKDPAMVRKADLRALTIQRADIEGEIRRLKRTKQDDRDDDYDTKLQALKTRLEEVNGKEQSTRVRKPRRLRNPDGKKHSDVAPSRSRDHEGPILPRDAAQPVDELPAGQVGDQFRPHQSHIHQSRLPGQRQLPEYYASRARHLMPGPAPHAPGPGAHPASHSR